MKKLNSFFLIASLVTLLSQSISANEEPKDTNQSRFESLSKLTQVIGTVEKYYVDDIKLEEIVDKALKGLMQELDAHSTYLDKKSTKEMSIQTSGEFGGLGITVGMREDALTVISPIDDTPAYKAGVEAGDIILKIDDKSTLNMTLDEAVSLMRGKPKTPITLTVVRKGENKPIKINIVRDIIKINSVFAKTIEGEDVLYLRIASFDKNVTDKMRKAIKEHPKAKGIILDLRNNPGGLLTQAIGTVDLFVNNGIIVSQKGRNISDEEKFNATPANTITNVPLVVLVNGGSASASEIVSGALQDHKRAILVGEKTFGKGSVQAILPITADGSENIKLTIAKYYLPSGRTIQATGITPDVIAYPGQAVKAKDSEFKIKEADLKKHLEVELQKDSNDKKVKLVKKDDKNSEEKSKVLTKEEIANDNQATVGLAILKSLIIVNNKK